MSSSITAPSNTQVGIGYRHEIRKDIALNKAKIDCVELISENYIHEHANLRNLAKLAEEYKIVLHGVNLSIASPFIDENHLRKIKLACEITNANYYSDHLSVTKTESFSFGHLSPPVLTENVLDLVIKNINLVQDYLQLPLVLENITYNFDFKNNMKLSEFITQMVTRTGCGILLDLANLFINAKNHHFNPYEFIESIPLSSIVHVHIAGGYINKRGRYVDSHSKAVNQHTWELLDYLCKRTTVKTIILEHDHDFPEDFSILLNQLERARTSLETQEIIRG